MVVGHPPQDLVRGGLDPGPSIEYSGLVCTNTHAPTMFTAISTPITGTASPRIIITPPTDSSSRFAGPATMPSGTPLCTNICPTPTTLRPPKSNSSHAWPIISTPRPMRATSRARSRAVPRATPAVRGAVEVDMAGVLPSEDVCR
jgi:hypothetical protein